MPSPTAIEKTNALAQSQIAKDQLDSALTNGGHEGDLIAVMIPVRYKVAVIKNPASLLSDADAKILAETTLKLEFYEE